MLVIHTLWPLPHHLGSLAHDITVKQSSFPGVSNVRDEVKTLGWE